MAHESSSSGDEYASDGDSDSESDSSDHSDNVSDSDDNKAKAKQARQEAKQRVLKNALVTGAFVSLAVSCKFLRLISLTYDLDCKMVR